MRLSSALIALSLVPACQRARQEAFEQRTREATGVDSVQLTEDGKRVTLSHRTDGGDTEMELGSNARIPADFPRNVPIYPGAKLIASVGSTDRGRRSHVVTLTATAAADVVYAFYKQRLPSFGTVEEVNLAGIRMLTARSSGGTTLEVMVTADGQSASTIQLMTSASA
jgi:hypothetical protein